MKIIDGEEQSASILGANWSKIHLVSYNSYVCNGIQQYRMAKGKVISAKFLLFVVTLIEKDGHTQIEQSIHQAC